MIRKEGTSFVHAHYCKLSFQPVSWLHATSGWIMLVDARASGSTILAEVPIAFVDMFWGGISELNANFEDLLTCPAIRAIQLVR